MIMKPRVRFILVSVLFLIRSLSTYGQGVTLEEARELYSSAMNDKVVCEEAFSKFSQLDQPESFLLTGYKGAVTVAMSKHLKTAKEKMTYFNDGKKLIEEAISRDTRNLELKFIRFTIQTNIPPILKYNKNISEDKTYILENLGHLKNNVVRSRIKAYLLISKELSSEEKDKLNAL